MYSAPGGEVSAIPSLIHYAADRRQWVGEQVSQLGLAESARTFRWMKRYIANRSPVTRRIDDRDISHAQAGADFLGLVLVYAAGELGLRDEEIALTVPVEAFEHYENWLLRAAETAGFARCRLIDEASAAALGYGAGVGNGQALLVFDFGGGTDIGSLPTIVSSIADAEWEEGNSWGIGARAGFLASPRTLI